MRQSCGSGQKEGEGYLEDGGGQMPLPCWSCWQWQGCLCVTDGGGEHPNSPPQSAPCSPHVVLTLPCPPLPPPQGLILLLFVRNSHPSTFPIQSSLLAVACPPSAAPSSIPMGNPRWAVYLRPGGSVQSWILRAKTPLPAWCSCSRLPSCPDQPPHLFLLPRSLLRHRTARHSRPPPRHTLTHTQKEPRCGEQRHKIQTQAMCHTHTHSRGLKVRNRACCSGAVNVL